MTGTDPDDRTIDNVPTAPTDTAPESPAVPPAGLPEVPGYEVLGLLGEGGMGLVYRARDLTLNRDLAVKALKGPLRGSPAALRRFVEEAQVTGQLQHPGVRALTVLSLLTAALAATALARPPRPGGGRETEFAAQEYRLLDPNGGLRGLWQCPPAGPALTLFDEGGRPAVELRLDADGGGRLRLTADGRVLDQRP